MCINYALCNICITYVLCVYLYVSEDDASALSYKSITTESFPKECFITQLLKL